MWQNANVKNTSIILRMLLIVGLVVSPLYPRAFAAGDQTMAMSATHIGSDEMLPCAGADNATSLCHDGEMDCGKACMAACMSLSVQYLPATPSSVGRVVIEGQRFAIHSEVRLASLAALPPARPPRT